ncbi:hypothetical protein U1Q18_002849 [Sarracenia purpurea var. burkii]
MTKRYATLQRKLEELESSVAEVTALPAETPCHHLLSESIEQRLLFLNNLLSAEMASHPSKPHHLDHIAQKLAYLESVFRHWDDHQTDSAAAEADALGPFDVASTCSCTESCLNDDGEDFDVFEDLPAVEENAPIESVRDGKREEGRDRMWAYFRVWGSGVVLGAVLMGFVMVRFSGCFRYTEYEGCLIPT